MALFLSHLHSKIIGSLGGITYFNTRYGTIVGRCRVTPKNPQTVGQNKVRALFSSAVNGFKTLTPAERATWQDYADGTPVQNGVDETVYLTAQAWYIAIRTAVLGAGISNDPDEFKMCTCLPGVYPQPIYNVIPCGELGEIGGKIEIQNTHPSFTCKHRVWLSTGYSPSVRYHTGPWDYSMNITSEQCAPDSIIEVPFCQLCDGERYFFMIRSIADVPPYTISSPVYGYIDAVPYTP